MRHAQKRISWAIAVFLMTALLSCTPSTPPLQEREVSSSSESTSQLKAGSIDGTKPNSTASSLSAQNGEAQASLPVRFQTPSYSLNPDDESLTPMGDNEEFVVKVGADISSTTGPVLLRDIMKRLASLKNMNISWASDVDQYSFVDVDIRADDDFFNAIDNLLRQRDYFHEVQGNTIVIKYKETRKFHLAMPFTSSKYSTALGGDVLGSTKDTNIKGSMELTSEGNTFDIWLNIKNNLDQVLQIWENTQANTPPPTPKSTDETGAAGSAGVQDAVKVSQPQSAKGYYTIDKPIGLITVTAPRLVLEKVDNYLTNLKKELYKQISIEAKILEVTVTNERKTGIDWSDLLSGGLFDFTMQFGDSSFNQPLGPSGSRMFTIGAKNFNLLLTAIEKQGNTKILANPKLSVMNGQPAMINVGESVTYIESVTSTVSEGIVTYTVNTSSVMSGLGMSVIATILDNNEVILNLTPVTSKLDKPIEYKNFGGNNQVGLPVVNLREMSTLVRVKNGEMLIIGGLIDTTDDNNDTEVPLLGRIPIIKNFFSSDSKIKANKELIILLRPQIIS
ncbi:MAG: pilus (MSHA type) biogenesis protein MshL [Proteobacteria bacterium]|nr:pilus (MSHA type) biogenesis protein MshL [Pseudomonadota bacterium]MBU1687549.1 pilus (MSHA type) biogenesis protein MshL [Pseudomonadota bacterium]